MMKKLLICTIMLGGYLVAGCTTLASISASTAGPAIKNITTSTKVLAKSDCIPTSVTITADVSSNPGIKFVNLWYRIGKNQEYTPAAMLLTEGNTYSATVVALDIPGGEYGPLEFYIVAGDTQGNQTQSRLDTSVELLPCVAS